MNTYFYFYVAEEDLHAVMVQHDNKDGTFSVRPLMAYFREKTAREIVRRYTERAMDRRALPPVRTNAPIEYRKVPEWWTDRCPDWSHMEKVV